MTAIVTKEADSIIKSIDITRYFLFPRHKDAFLTVQMENASWGISDDHAGEFTCYICREEAEKEAEHKIVQYHREWMEIREETLPDETDDPEWDVHAADCMWMEKAAKAVDTRTRCKCIQAPPE